MTGGGGRKVRRREGGGQMGMGTEVRDGVGGRERQGRGGGVV